MYSIFTTSNTSYVFLQIFMQFVAVKAKTWWNNKGSSSFFWNTVYICFASWVSQPMAYAVACCLF